MKKLELYILILGIVLCAVVYSAGPLDRTLSIRHIVWAVTTIILFFSISIRAIKGNVDFGFLKTVIFPVFCIYILFSVLSLIKAVNVSEGLYSVLKATLLLFYLFCATVILEDKKTLCKWMVILAISLSIYGLYGLLAPVEKEAVTRYGNYFYKRGGTMSNRNLWSSALLLLLPFCFYVIFNLKKCWKIIAIIAEAMLIFNIVTLGTRSVQLAFIVSFLSLAIFRPKLLIPLVLSCVVATGLVWGLRGKSGIVRNFVYKLTYKGSLSERRDLWTQTLKLTDDNLKLGVGAGNWKMAIARYAPHIKTYRRGITCQDVFFISPHNDYLMVLSEIGIFGFVFYVLIFVCGLFYLFKTGSVFLMGLVASMVVAFFSFSTIRTFAPMMLMIFLALGIRDYERYVRKFRTERIYPRKFRPLVAVYVSSIVVMGILALTLVDFSLRYRGECNTRKIVDARKEKQWDKIRVLSERYSWFYQLDPLSTPLLWYKGVANFRLGDQLQAFRDFHRAEKANPYHPVVLRDLGCCYAMLKQYEKAHSYFNRSLDIVPNHENTLGARLSNIVVSWKT